MVYIQGMELQKFRSSSLSSEGATCTLRAAITLGIGPHSSYICVFPLCACVVSVFLINTS